MKCTFLYEMTLDASTAAESLLAQATIVTDAKGRQIPVAPIGTVFEGPNAAFFVRHGCAEPDDDECRLATKMTEEQLATTRRAYAALHACIAKEDIELFNAGVIAGYNADGSYRPGANFDQLAKFQPETTEDEDI
jgi:hypothetical protein